MVRIFSGFLLRNFLYENKNTNINMRNKLPVKNIRKLTGVKNNAMTIKNNISPNPIFSLKMAVIFFESGKCVFEGLKVKYRNKKIIIKAIIIRFCKKLERTN